MCVLFPKSQGFFSSSFTIHRLAAKAFLQSMDIGFGETPAKTKKDVLKVSIDCGVISSHTAFIAINKDVNKPVQGPLACRDVPRPVLLCAAAPMTQCKRVGEWVLPHLNSCDTRGPRYVNTSFEVKACELEFFFLASPHLGFLDAVVPF